MRCFFRRHISGITAALSIISILIAGGCANIGTPSGGPRDEDPPILVSANPNPGSILVDRNKMTLTFNELVNVKDAFSKVVVSPTSKSVPRISSSGRRVTIEFDSLVPNTTYTVDFADAIEDNNEGNKIPSFTYTFSTGETIDTMRISGRVMDARNLEPRQGILVGVHSNPADSAFTSSRLLRVAKTDDRGRFTIRGLAPGLYRVFALDDKDNDYKYSSPEEDIAFYEFTVEPSSRQTTATDTIYNELTGEPDSIVTRRRTQYLPNDIILRTFNSEKRQQYMTKYERLDSTRVFLKFNTEASELPKIKVLGNNNTGRLGTLETSARLDSLVWWLTPELMKTDTLKLEVSYTRSDQNLKPTSVTDTLDFITKRVQVKQKGKKKKLSLRDSIAAITSKFEIKSPSIQEINMPLYFESPTPLTRFDTTAFHLSVMVDTTYVPIAASSFRLTRADTINPRRYVLVYPWAYDSKYKLEIDTLAGTDIYGKVTVPLTHEFRTREAGEYCSLLLRLTGLHGTPAFVELLNSSDAVQRTVNVEKNGDAYFPYLLPGRYYARVILDYNANGKYDTGNYEMGTQPELAYYYPKAINLKKNWDKQENWDVFSIPLDMMKPQQILKNKPALDRRSRLNKENEQEDEEEEIFDPTRNPFAN